MKKIIFAIALLFSLNSAKAQSPQTKITIDGVEINSMGNVQYIQLVFTQKFLSTKVRCAVDYGQAFEFGADTRVQGDNGEVKNFNSVIDGLNYFVGNGWEFVTSYPITTGNANVYHYLLRRKK